MAPSLSTILEPRMACRFGKTEDPIECSLHILPKQLQREFQHVFGDKYLDIKERTDNAYGQQDQIIIIVLCLMVIVLWEFRNHHHHRRWNYWQFQQIKEHVMIW